MVRDCVVGWEKRVSVAEAGGRPLYRSREWEAEERQQKKILKKTSWYRSRADVPVFFPATPQGVLAKNIQKVLDEEQGRLGMRVKVMEKGGLRFKV